MNGEFENLWRETSREALWREIEAHWEESRLARVVLLLGKHHDQSLSLETLAEKTGLRREWIENAVASLQERGVLVCDEANNCRIADQQIFLDYLTQFFRHVEIEAGHLELLANWAGGRLDAPVLVPASPIKSLIE